MEWEVKGNVTTSCRVWHMMLPATIRLGLSLWTKQWAFPNSNRQTSSTTKTLNDIIFWIFLNVSFYQYDISFLCVKSQPLEYRPTREKCLLLIDNNENSWKDLFIKYLSRTYSLKQLIISTCVRWGDLCTLKLEAISILC